MSSSIGRKALRAIGVLALGWVAFCIASVGYSARLDAQTKTTAFQVWFKATGTGSISVQLVKLLGLNVLPEYFGAACDGATDDHTAMQNALNSTSGVPVVIGPNRTCSLGTTGISIPANASLVGSGRQSSIIQYSGTACAITVDSVQATRLESFALNVLGNNGTKRGLCYFNTTAAELRGVARNLRIWADGSFPRTSGSVGVLLSATTTCSLYYNDFEEIDLNLWDVSVKGIGTASPTTTCGAAAVNGPNGNFWRAIVSSAANTGLTFLTNTNDNHVESITCNGGGYTGAQTCVVLGDGSTTTAGHWIRLISDQGSNGTSFAILAAALNNTIFSTDESTNAGTDANATLTNTNIKIEQKPAAFPTVVFGNVTIGQQLIAASPTPNTGPFILRSAVANGATSIAWSSRTNATLTVAGGIIHEFWNGATKSSIDKDGGHLFVGLTQANLGTPPNGTIQYCSDCTIANPCAAVGTGALAKRLNGVWVCN